MENVVVTIFCDFCLLFVIRRLLGDFLGNVRSKSTPNVNFFLCFLWIAGTLAVDALFHVPILNLLANLGLTFLLAFPHAGSILKKLLVSILISVVSAACDLFAYLILALVLDEESYYYSFIFTVIFMLLVERGLGSVLRRGRAWKIVRREFVLMIGFPVLATVILYCITEMEGGRYKIVASIAVLLISILSIVVYERMMEKIEANWKRDLLEKRVEGYKHELETMKNSERRMQNFRHDLRHHFVEMESLAKQDKTKELCEYIHDMEKTFADSKRIVHTGEYETDSLVNFLLADAQNRGIEIDAGISMPEELNISKFKMNIILGNLLENAIEAASKAEKKKLVLKMNYSSGTIFLRIKNTYSGTILIENGKVKGKHITREHGIGIRSVRDLVEEQSGRMEISINENWFTTEILITESGEMMTNRY